ncbi:MAG: hypothetical protein V3V24_09815 [Nitrospinaceae bacterium]
MFVRFSNCLHQHPHLGGELHSRTTWTPRFLLIRGFVGIAENGGEFIAFDLQGADGGVLLDALLG